MKFQLIKNELDSELIREEISVLREKLKTIKEQNITEENVRLLQELDTEITDKLKKYILHTM